MSTPPNFQLEAMDPAARPPAMPPRYIKYQIYREPAVFKAIDDHAINEARTNYRNFRDLLWNLIYKKNFVDLEKARAIFRWMTTKNMYTIMFDSELPGSPEAVLGGFKDGKTTYARIFECLCSFAGLHCVTLSGWAKGVDYRPGAPITSGPINHSWNAVFLDGMWQLVDSHWATRYLQSERNTPENLVYEYDDFYFIPEPRQLIYSHCPEEPAWQLLYPAVSRADFEDYPLIKSFFFTVGMQFLQQNQGVLYTKNGIVVLTLGFVKPTAFTFKLTYGDTMVEAIQGINLKRYVIQETLDNRVSFYFRAPREGNYYITVFAQQVGERIRIENVFKAACEYKIVCDQAAGDIRPYPQCSDSNWGPGAPVRQYGLTPSHKDAILMAPNGRAEVSFQKSRDVRLYARLNKDGMDDDTLERCVNVREQENQIYVTVQLPARGEYGLEIYANEPDREGDTFTHMCQYLTSYIDRDPVSQYGQVYDRADFAFDQSQGPMTYEGPGTAYAGQGPDQYRTGPGQYGPGRTGPSQYAAGQTAPGQYAPGGQYQPGQPGSAQYGPGGQYQQPGQDRYGPGAQQFKGEPQEAMIRQGAPGLFSSPDDRASDAPDKQVYQTSSQDWDGNTFTQKQFRQEIESGGDANVQYSTKRTQMSTRMETVTIGGKQAPPTAPKPGQGHPGYGSEYPGGTDQQYGPGGLSLPIPVPVAKPEEGADRPAEKTSVPVTPTGSPRKWLKFRKGGSPGGGPETHPGEPQTVTAVISSRVIRPEAKLIGGSFEDDQQPQTTTKTVQLGSLETESPIEATITSGSETQQYPASETVVMTSVEPIAGSPGTTPPASPGDPEVVAQAVISTTWEREKKKKKKKPKKAKKGEVTPAKKTKWGSLPTLESEPWVPLNESRTAPRSQLRGHDMETEFKPDASWYGPEPQSIPVTITASQSDEPELDLHRQNPHADIRAHNPVHPKHQFVTRMGDPVILAQSVISSTTDEPVVLNQSVITSSLERRKKPHSPGTKNKKLKRSSVPTPDPKPWIPSYETTAVLSTSPVECESIEMEYQPKAVRHGLTPHPMPAAITTSPLYGDDADFSVQRLHVDVGEPDTIQPEYWPMAETDEPVILAQSMISSETDKPVILTESVITSTLDRRKAPLIVTKNDEPVILAQSMICSEIDEPVVLARSVISSSWDRRKKPKSPASLVKKSKRASLPIPEPQPWMPLHEKRAHSETPGEAKPIKTNVDLEATRHGQQPQTMPAAIITSQSDESDTDMRQPSPIWPKSQLLTEMGEPAILARAVISSKTDEPVVLAQSVISSSWDRRKKKKVPTATLR